MYLKRVAVIEAESTALNRLKDAPTFLLAITMFKWVQTRLDANEAIVHYNCQIVCINLTELKIQDNPNIDRKFLKLNWCLHCHMYIGKSVYSSGLYFLAGL